MTKTELVNQVANNTGMSKADAERFLDATSNVLTETLKQGNEATLPGIGKFSTESKPERSGRNPRTGESITLPPKTTVKFKASKPLNDALN